MTVRWADARRRTNGIQEHRLRRLVETAQAIVPKVQEQTRAAEFLPLGLPDFHTTVDALAPASFHLLNRERAMAAAARWVCQDLPRSLSTRARRAMWRSGRSSFSMKRSMAPEAEDGQVNDVKMWASLDPKSRELIDPHYVRAPRLRRGGRWMPILTAGFKTDNVVKQRPWLKLKPTVVLQKDGRALVAAAARQTRRPRLRPDWLVPDAPARRPRRLAPPTAGGGSCATFAITCGTSEQGGHANQLESWDLASLARRSRHLPTLPFPGISHQTIQTDQGALRFVLLTSAVGSPLATFRE